MVAKHSILFAWVAGGLMACTTRPDPELPGQTPVAIPPPEISIELPLEQKAPRDPGAAQACLLSTTKSCMALDTRAFQPCLLDARSCQDLGEGGITPLEAPVIDYSLPQPR
jgi:hypothetical protein